MVTGSCLCKEVRFEIDQLSGPFELCHCQRCRKASSSAFMAVIVVNTRHFRLIQGEELLTTYQAPIIEQPPAYQTTFCTRCGSALPNALPGSDWIEVPAGLVDGDLPIRPDRHIYVEHKASWYQLCGNLPQFTKAMIQEFRAKK